MPATKSLALEWESADLRRARLGFIAPFVVYVAALILERLGGVSPGIVLPVRLCAVLGTILAFSRPYLNQRPASPQWSILLGFGVFAVWVAPDLLFHYRHSVLFENALTGSAVSSIPVPLRSNQAFLALRTISCVIAVPILEELFWRGWMMRWLVDKNFIKIPFGLYVPSAFWTVAILFASEHGPYWEVGLAAGLVYNWWVIRTKNLTDCILAHAVTNACLSTYVLATGLWRYWL